MAIHFSEHAILQLKERGISRKIVLNAMKQPDKIQPQERKRFRALKQIAIQGKLYLLIVIYDQEKVTQTIVTAFRTSKLEKYL